MELDEVVLWRSADAQWTGMLGEGKEVSCAGRLASKEDGYHNPNPGAHCKDESAMVNGLRHCTGVDQGQVRVLKERGWNKS